MLLRGICTQIYVHPGIGTHSQFFYFLTLRYTTATHGFTYAKVRKPTVWTLQIVMVYFKNCNVVQNVRNLQKFTYVYWYTKHFFKKVLYNSKYNIYIFLQSAKKIKIVELNRLILLPLVMLCCNDYVKTWFDQPDGSMVECIPIRVRSDWVEILVAY